MFELTILVPTRNDPRVKDTLIALAKYLDSKGMNETTEVILVDGHSTDNTVQEAAGVSSAFRHYRVVYDDTTLGKGKGVGIITGMKEANGELVIYMDADLATPLYHIDELLEKASLGSDVVIGVRDTTKHHTGLLRKFISWGGNIAVQAVLLPGIKDTQAGFKLFTKEAADKVFPLLTLRGWTFDMEALAVAKKVFKYRISTIELPDWEDKAGGTFAPSSAVAVESLIDLAKIRLKLWSGYYGKRRQ